MNTLRSRQKLELRVTVHRAYFLIVVYSSGKIRTTTSTYPFPTIRKQVKTILASSFAIKEHPFLIGVAFHGFSLGPSFTPSRCSLLVVHTYRMRVLLLENIGILRLGSPIAHVKLSLKCTRENVRRFKV